MRIDLDEIERRAELRTKRLDGIRAGVLIDSLQVLALVRVVRAALAEHVETHSGLGTLIELLAALEPFEKEKTK